MQNQNTHSSTIARQRPPVAYVVATALILSGAAFALKGFAETATTGKALTPASKTASVKHGASNSLAIAR